VALVIDGGLPQDLARFRVGSQAADWDKKALVARLRTLAGRLAGKKLGRIPKELRLALNALQRSPEQPPQALLLPPTSVLLIPRMGNLAIQERLAAEVRQYALDSSGRVRGAKMPARSQ
jgi:hypothetical protein